MMLIPLAAFWVLVFIGRGELRLKGVLFWVALWIGLLSGCMALGLPSYWFVAAQAIVDAILILIIFGEDIRIR